MADYDHAGLKELAKELKRPLSTLEVLSLDPFTAGTPGRLAGAQWFALLWEELGGASHVHAFHYKLISQDTPVAMPSGKNYENTKEDEAILIRCALDARYLGLVPADDFADRRNDEPIYNDPPEASDGCLGICQTKTADLELPDLDLPGLGITAPVIAQRFRLVVVIEKSTMNHILQPLCERYNADFIYGVGEQSLTRCVQAVRRASAHSLPTRILYISDFDPAGMSMPVAFARKIQHQLYVQEIWASDIQLRSIALTHEQCIRLRLPRTPIKETELRAAGFEARFGEGATELDALEALHPGELERIVTQEIWRYYDLDLADSVTNIVGDIQANLDEITERVHEQHAEAIAEAEAEREKLQAAIEAYQEKIQPILDAIESDLEDEAPSIEDYDWPEPDEGDEDDDPLFDSTRDYVEQVDRFKDHQGKPTERRARGPLTGHKATCIAPNCGKEFIAYRSDAQTCSDKCASALKRARKRGEVSPSTRGDGKRDYKPARKGKAALKRRVS
jgi:hypothetical protein